MRKGVVNTAAFLLFLSDGVLARSFVQFEIREAMTRQKMILLVHESDARFGAFDFRTGRAEAPVRTCRSCSTPMSRFRFVGEGT